MRDGGGAAGTHRLGLGHNWNQERREGGRERTEDRGPRVLDLLQAETKSKPARASDAWLSQNFLDFDTAK
jgi:hypothetical protein